VRKNENPGHYLNRCEAEAATVDLYLGLRAVPRESGGPGLGVSGVDGVGCGSEPASLPTSSYTHTY
jgi:hypothetical protein